jgi:hypothetical protein
MMDYLYERSPGHTVTVEQMLTSEIHDVLRSGFTTEGSTPPEAITERLRLELLIREKGMRQ